MAASGSLTAAIATGEWGKPLKEVAAAATVWTGFLDTISKAKANQLRRELGHPPILGDEGDPPAFGDEKVMDYIVVTARTLSAAMTKAGFNALQTASMQVLYDFAAEAAGTTPGFRRPAEAKATQAALGPAQGAAGAQATAGSGVKLARSVTIKVAEILDQSDPAEVTVDERMKDRYTAALAKFVDEHGDEPRKLPSEHQFLVLLNRAAEGGDIYADFAVFRPGGKRIARAIRVQTQIPTAEGWRIKELAGPATFDEWSQCWELMTATLVMLRFGMDIGGVQQSMCDKYRRKIKSLHEMFGPQHWGLIYKTDMLARSERWPYILRRQYAKGQDCPPEFKNDTNKWNAVVRHSTTCDAEWWQEQVGNKVIAAQHNKGAGEGSAERAASELRAVGEARGPQGSGQKRAAPASKRAQKRARQATKKGKENSGPGPPPKMASLGGGSTKDNYKIGGK